MTKDEQQNPNPDLPGVIHVVPNRILSLQTTRSCGFFPVKPHVVNGILSKGQSGVGSIIGILDTGIWPESASFRDVGMGEVPSHGKGICQRGEEFNSPNCNSLEVPQLEAHIRFLKHRKKDARIRLLKHRKKDARVREIEPQRERDLGSILVSSCLRMGK